MNTVALDAGTLIRRRLEQLAHEPGEIVGMLVFPVIMVVLFGFVFGSAINVPGGGNYREYLMPGLFVMTAAASIASNMLSVATDHSRGVMDRFRSMPMNRSAVPLGQTGSDLLLGLIAMVMMLICGYAFSWRAHNGLGPALAAIGLVVLFRYTMSWIGTYLGLLVKNEGTADQLSPLFLPVTMLSNAFVPTGGMPAWLRVVTEWNPISATVAACRSLFGNPGVPTVNPAWPLAHPVVATLAWSAVLLAIFVPLSIRKFAKAGL
jgi:ABC-2 type transport system permease protein